MKHDISLKNLREFGYLIGFGFPIIIGWILPLISGHSFRSWTLLIGLPSLLIGIIKPRLLFLPYIGWMKLGNILGWINSRLILGVVFLIVLQPIAVLMKIFGYDPLREKRIKLQSYREIRKEKNINLNIIF